MQRLIRTFDGYLSKLTTAQIEKYKITRSQGVAPTTVNPELALLKRMRQSPCHARSTLGDPLGLSSGIKVRR
jgi:hypothetical protein